MGPQMERPFEVDPVEYPFTDRWLSYADGHIHYVRRVLERTGQ
jgi:hypothetical protein